VPSYRERLRRYRFAMLLGLTSVVMLFISFTTAYVVRKAGTVYDPAHNDYTSNWVPIHLPIALLLLNSLILLLSSATLEIARNRAAQDAALAPVARIPGIRVSLRHSLPSLWATILLGFAFLGGQYYAWQRLQLVNNLAGNISGGFFFMLTGVHAVHLLGGLLALLYAGLSFWLRRPPETRRLVLDVTAWYWHFMAVLWIYVFALLYFAR
jgi:cytochrome c oxidase subunit 3